MPRRPTPENTVAPAGMRIVEIPDLPVLPPRRPVARSRTGRSQSRSKAPTGPTSSIDPTGAYLEGLRAIVDAADADLERRIRQLGGDTADTLLVRAPVESWADDLPRATNARSRRRRLGTYRPPTPTSPTIEAMAAVSAGLRELIAEADLDLQARGVSDYHAQRRRRRPEL